jgi:hypothetical protein
MLWGRVLVRQVPPPPGWPEQAKVNPLNLPDPDDTPCAGRESSVVGSLFCLAAVVVFA